MPTRGRLEFRLAILKKYLEIFLYMLIPYAHTYAYVNSELPLVQAANNSCVLELLVVQSETNKTKTPPEPGMIALLW